MKINEYYEKVMEQFRCSNCNKLLYKGKMHGDYHIEIMCARCKNVNVFDRKIVNLTKKEK